MNMAEAGQSPLRVLVRGATVRDDLMTARERETRNRRAELDGRLTGERKVRDREVGDESPHLDGRAQPGDVIGLETGGESTHIGDTAEDENKRRIDAERDLSKRRD